MKRKGVLVVGKRTTTRYKDPVLWARLAIFMTPKR